MLVDSHCHLPHEKYLKNLEEIINEAKEAGVTKLINIGTSLEENKKAEEISRQHDNIYCALGIYPHEDLDKSFSEIRKQLSEDLKSTKKLVAVGECGIDISEWEGGRSLEGQKKLFELQIELAIESNLPLVIHNRNADAVILDTLLRYKQARGVIHCFSSSWEIAKKFLSLGYYLSFSGMITYPSRLELTEVVKNVPDDKFILETDSPYLPIHGHRGEVNYPKYVKIVAEKASQIKEKPFLEVSRLSYENTCRLFKI
jgi:TatD DNase family protein